MSDNTFYILLVFIICFFFLGSFKTCSNYDNKKTKIMAENGFIQETVKGEDGMKWIKPNIKN